MRGVEMFTRMEALEPLWVHVLGLGLGRLRLRRPNLRILTQLVLLDDRLLRKCVLRLLQALPKLP